MPEHSLCLAIPMTSPTHSALSSQSSRQNKAARPVVQPRSAGIFTTSLQGGSCLLLGLLLLSCDRPAPPQSSQRSRSAQQGQSLQQPMARRRAVSPSQRREARMARPASPSNQPRVDYGPYRQIHPEMTLAEVQAILGHSGQGQQQGQALGTNGFVANHSNNSRENGPSGDEPFAKGSVTSALAAEEPEENQAEALFWRWTHPSQAYNIHLRLKAGAEPGTFIVQAKWLTYNPPGQPPN